MISDTTCVIEYFVRVARLCRQLVQKEAARRADEVKSLRQTAADLAEAGASGHVEQEAKNLASQHSHTVDQLNVSFHA